ncbi:hypothetical protein AURDEDRAFT_177012 [Auricularia subglabra TFB-10046 SS5]|uniref:F-box domain-containing protein n=1 Tax=Auricularia subglabra (strain TFB-10046 / SS5) TaxID=717982 RepID=J0WPY6_AURST|nr:hypothetical protein AURDEDRAFT_177012 [Auricularia subglabra TFB-10046 SS5]
MSDELLLRVFSCLPFWDRVRAATVCHRWRTVALCVKLWRVFPTIYNIASYGALITRSGADPVTLTHEGLTPELALGFAALLRAHLHHVQSLTIAFEYLGVDWSASAGRKEASSQLAEALSCSAPFLEHFALRDYRSVGYRDYLDVRVLNLPKIRALDLRGLDMGSLRAWEGSPTINSITLRLPSAVQSLVEDDWRVICSYPGVEHLSLDLSTLSSMSSGAQLGSGLKHLDLCVPWACFENFASSRDLSTLRSLRVQFTVPPDTWQSLGELLPFVPKTAVTAAIDFPPTPSHRQMANLTAWTDRGLQITFRDVAYDPGLPHVLCKVRKLSLSGFATCCPDVIPQILETLPLVAELTFDMTVEELPREDPARHPLRLTKPTTILLETLRFVSARPRSAVPLAYILPILDGLGGERVRPARLIFDRVPPRHPDDLDPLVPLRAFAEDVVVAESQSVWPEYRGKWSWEWDDGNMA